MKIDGITLEPIVYRIVHSDGPGMSVTLVCCGERWAIREFGSCLTETGEWMSEPMPSERSARFLVRCRFDTPERAIAAWKKFLAAAARTNQAAGPGGVGRAACDARAADEEGS